MDSKFDQKDLYTLYIIQQAFYFYKVPYFYTLTKEHFANACLYEGVIDRYFAEWFCSIFLIMI